MEIEFRILDFLQAIRTPVGDAVMCFITKLGDAGMIWMVLAVILLLLPKTRKTGLVMMAALCIELIVCNGILKNLFARIRPCDVNTQIQLLIARPDDFSFPSGHTASSFAAVAALYVSGEKNCGNRHWSLRASSHFQDCICMFIFQPIYWGAFWWGLQQDMRDMQ